MFTPKTRLIILGVCLLLGAFSYYKGNPYGMIVIAMVLLINLYGFIRQGTVYLAFKQLRKGDHKEAEETLSLTKKVNWLSKTQKAYYHFVRGYIDMAKGNVEHAKEAFKTATDLKLRLQNDQALALANLATLYHRSKNKVSAREYLQRTEKLKVKKSTKKELDRLHAMLG